MQAQTVESGDQYEKETNHPENRRINRPMTCIRSVLYPATLTPEEELKLGKIHCRKFFWGGNEGSKIRR